MTAPSTDNPTENASGEPSTGDSVKRRVPEWLEEPFSFTVPTSKPPYGRLAEFFRSTY